MAQDVVQQIQRLLGEGRFQEARALLEGLDRPEVPQLLALLDQMELTAGAGSPAGAVPSAGAEAADIDFVST